MAESAVPSDSVTLQGAFTSGKLLYSLVLYQSGTLTWCIQQATGEVVLKVPRREILSVTSVIKTDTDVTVGFKIGYIEHGSKHILKRAYITFHGSPAECSQWVTTLQELIDTAPDRPRKALVFVNPISGRSKSVKVYETVIAPIFKECGLATDVIVTQKAHHTEKILSTYDLSSVDSIVSVGGDGLYHEVCNGVLIRQMKEQGQNMDDPDIVMKEMSLPVGIIPSGTGNALANCCNGNLDFETAALAIIMGKRVKSNVIPLYVNGKLKIIGALMVGYGFWGDLIFQAETNRQLGVSRYRVVMLGFMFRRQRSMSVNVDYLKESESVRSTSDTRLNTANKRSEHQNSTAKKNRTEASDQRTRESVKDEVSWHSQVEDDVGSIIVMIDDAPMLLTSRPLVSNSFTTSITTKAMRGVKKLQSMYELMTMNMNFFKKDFAHHERIKGMRVKLNHPHAEDTSDGRKERIVNVDGEICQINATEFEIRLQQSVVPVFAAITPEETKASE